MPTFNTSALLVSGGNLDSRLPSSFDAILQIFRPGGITNQAGTPNFLLAFDPDTYQATWKDMQQGGLESATFMVRKPYEETTDVVFGNWVVYAQGGGYLSSDVTAGDTTISVKNLGSINLTDASGNQILNIQSGDNIIISDGVNTEQFVASAISGAEPRTITLGPAPGVNQSSLLNNFSAASTKICRLVYQGIIQRRVRNTDLSNTYQIQCLGMFNRYSNVLGSSVATAVDGGTLVQDILSSYSSTLPEIIYNASNTVSSSTPVTVSAKDQRISEILGSILVQEASQSGSTSGTGGTSVIPRTLSFLNAGDPTQTTLFKLATSPLTISNSDSSVATAAEGNTVTSGVQVVVTPVGKGSCTITVTDANSKTASFTVNVQNAPMQTSGLVYAIGVGADRQVYHKLIPTDGSPTKTIDITQPSSLGDVLAPLETTDMDGSNLVNAAIVRGGSDSNGNRLRIIVRDTYSHDLLNAWYEGVLDNSSITSEKELANWAAGQLAITAYPSTAAKLNLTTTSMRITTQDLIQINGFTDGSTLLVNPLEIQYMVDAKNQVATAQITLGVLRPQVKAFAKEVASERAIRETYNLPGVNPTFGVISGLNFEQGTGLNFTITAGVIAYEGTQYSVPAYSGTAPASSTSYWGVQVSGGSASIVQMPSAQAISLQAAQNVYEISYRGGPAVASTSFTGIGLYKVTTNATAIIGVENIALDTYTVGRLPASAPSFTGISASYNPNGPNAYNVTVTFSGTAQSGATGVSVYLATHPSTSSSAKINPQLLPLDAGGNYTVTFAGLPNGTQTYDVWAAFIDGSGTPGTYTDFYATSAFTGPQPGSGGKMPSNTTAIASFVSETTLNSWTHPYLIEVDFTVDSSQTTAVWASEVEMVYQLTNRTFLMNDANAGATSITVAWPFAVGLSVNDAVTLSSGGNTESVAVSGIGTPSTTSYGTQTCVLTLASGLIHSYTAYSEVRGPGSASWSSCGRLPVNSGGSYTGVWAAPPYSTLAVRLIDYSGGSSNVSGALYYVSHYMHLLGANPQQGASGYTPNVISKTSLTYTNAGNGGYDAQCTVTFDANGTTSNPWISAIEFTASSKNVSTTLNGNVSKGATSILLTDGSSVSVGDQLTIDSGSSIEYAEVSGVSGNTITLPVGLQLAHSSGAAVTVNAWTHYGYLPVKSTTAYLIDWVSLGAGNVYQLGVRLEDQAGNTSYTVTVGTTSANPLTNTAMPGMPNGATISVTNVTEAVYDGGMHTL